MVYGLMVPFKCLACFKTPLFTNGCEKRKAIRQPRPQTAREQSLFFFRFSKGSARARERRNRETRETRAPSVSRVAICVSRVLLDGLEKKERLLVVYRDLVSCELWYFKDNRFSERLSGACSSRIFLNRNSLLSPFNTDLIDPCSRNSGSVLFQPEKDRPVTRGGARGTFAPPPTGPKGPHFDTQYPS